MPKYNTSSSSTLAPLFVVLMLVLASCAKEEVCPAGHDENPGTIKSLTVLPLEDKPEGLRGSTRGTTGPDASGEDDGDDGVGIGDDGDDISGTERRKKR